MKRAVIFRLGDCFLKYQLIKLRLLLDKYLDKRKFSYFLFGSRTNGNSKFRSDIDIGLWTSGKINIEDFFKIKRLIEENIDWPVDVVDFTRVEEDFKKYVFTHKIQIWNATPDFLKLLKSYRKLILL